LNPRFIHSLRLALVAAFLAIPALASAQKTHPLYACADRIAGGLRDYTDEAASILFGTCGAELIKQGKIGTVCSRAKDVDAAGNPDGTPGNTAGKLVPVANHARCETAGNPADQSQTLFRKLCPLESRTTSLFLTNAAGSAPGTLRSDLAALGDDLFKTEYEGCPRPTAALVGNDLKDCANQIAFVAAREAEEILACYVSCERANLGDADACVNENTGNPTAESLIGCIAKNSGNVGEIENKCRQDGHVTALGCPLGARTVDGLIEAVATRLESYAQSASFSTFHASCRTSISGPPPELKPAKVTLLPSGTVKDVSCGQVLDATFFGSNKTLRFDTDLDCSAADSGVNGIVVATNGVTISGNEKSRQISGPSRKSLRTGVGILVAEGAKRVTITSFRRIQNFGVGVLAAGDNRKLIVRSSTVFRNLQAGIRSDSPKTKVVEVVADRNGIGFELSGNDSIIKLSEARASEPQSASAEEPLSPGWGFRLHGTDTDGDGVTVRCNQCTAQTSRVGFVLEGDGQLVEGSFARSNVGDGVWVDGTTNRFRNNSVKLNTGNGIVVKGTGNTVNKNQSDENLAAGFVVSGEGNRLTGNGAGSMTDKGNSQVGFLVTGAGNILDTNEAEANLGGGFQLLATPAVFKGNRAESNSGVGFLIETTGTLLDSNAAEKSSGFEWSVAAGNVDDSGNKANGKGISIPAEGGSFE